MITELTITDFRGFERLELKGLQRLNLIVGRNNAGKTSLLEALALACGTERVTELPALVRGQQPSDARFFEWLIRDRAAQASISGSASDGGQLGLTLARAQSKANRVQLPGGLWLEVAAKGTSPFRFVSVQHRASKDLVFGFGKAVRNRDDEKVVHDVLGAVDQRVTRVRVDPGDTKKSEQQIVVDVGLSESLPLSQVGQGIYRLVAILADLVGERPKVAFIDEIENGIHHTTLPQIWKGIAEVAERLDIQVFATTHSHECIEAGHEAHAARKTYDFAVIQLFRVERAIQGRVLQREQIEAALAGEIDLRQ